MYQLINRLINKVFRRLISYIKLMWLPKGMSWKLLLYYPSIIPTDDDIKEVNSSGWPEYQEWLEQNSLRSVAQWQSFRLRLREWMHYPRISIVTPVFNTDPEELYQCIFSVRAQIYPCWQLILVDDASTKKETLAMLNSALCSDSRIKVVINHRQKGISAATNLGLEHVRGDFVLFLDHDDRLSFDALFYIAQEINNYHNVDIIYSDRDMISTEGKRYMHLFKPDWSPETLLSGNYIFHPMIYRTNLLDKLGGLSEKFEGSQDYDLILRASETEPNVRHISKVLYHWRQSQQSVALTADTKSYAFTAGVKALNEALRRRNIKGTACEINSLWRGNYRLDLEPLSQDQYNVIEVGSENQDDFASIIADSIDPNKMALIFIDKKVKPVANTVFAKMASWCQFDKVGMIGGKILDEQQRIIYSGGVFRNDGGIIYPYLGFPGTEPGYMAVNRIARNVSVPAMNCTVINVKMWLELGGFNNGFTGPFALLDLALRSMQFGWRCIFDPQFEFQAIDSDILVLKECEEAIKFSRNWGQCLAKGDPYYNKNLSQQVLDMGIKL